MSVNRRVRLATVLVCLLASLIPAWSQNQSPPPQQQAGGQAKPAEQAKPAQQPAPANPFENVQPAAPQQQKPAQPGQPQLEAPKPAPEAPAPTAANVIEDIQFRGARRVPLDSLRAQTANTKKGDIYNEDALHRDFMALWNSGRFDDIRLETEPGKTGIILRWVLTERRVIRSINYSKGMKSVSVSEVLDRFKERKVGLVTESQYDPNKVQRAAVVLKEYLAERGRQYATVEPEIRQVPPSSLEITFNVNEGPKVKVGKIDIEGNQAIGDREVIAAMKNLHPLGVPHSIYLEGLFPKTYDSSKLDEDKERVRQFYQDKGYFTVRVLDQTVSIHDVGGSGFRLPLIKMNKPGKNADITLPIEEGKLMHLSKMNFVGVKLFRTTDFLQQRIFQMQDGDVFSTAKLRKGIENMKKLYGEFGYIDFVPEPSFDVNGDKVDLTLTADEGKQFFVRRIDFTGNTTTRDKVIRREILLDEGDIYNSRLWDVSILRLNQLGYFEVLKAEDAATLTRNTQSNTVDITLKVRERGKNSVSLNGGVSGIAGTFIGLGYATNNFLGLGETLSLNSQLGTLVRSVNLGFTEPYFLDRPIQVGFNVFLSRFDYNQAREESILTGQNLLPFYNALGSNNLLNYLNNTYGFTASASKMLRRSFARVGLTYGYTVNHIKTLSTAATDYFTYINFEGVNGPNSLTGIHTSSITPSYSYNTVSNPINPTSGKSIFIGTQFSGSFLGGNVNTVRPSVDFKYFHPNPLHRTHILAAHFMTSVLTGYGGKSAPPFSRTYMGGEQDIRGFDIWGVSPIGFIPSQSTVTVYNNDGTIRQQKALVNGVPTLQNVQQTVPSYQIIFPGGDTQILTNLEYRIPIFGPVTLALFLDAGDNRILLPGQLSINPSQVSLLNAQFPQAAFNGKVLLAPGTQNVRMSTGIEIQVVLPVVQAPFRVYWAYNPLRVDQNLQPPVVADRSFFPNNQTFLQSLAVFGQAYPFFERASTFRFTIGRTF
ncbi:MAG TPA: outer membrane protein assembly factor BamA [Bryobacteraceae bacterium]|nr:outer membrane protein assembly factor BamA [Bryobacteraceae bacterium]